VDLKCCYPSCFVLVFIIPASCVQASYALEKTKPIRLHTENPHYFEWRSKPTVLITAGEHYGVVINRDFDYKSVSRQQKWHRLRPLVRGDLQVFSCMQENT